MAEIRKCQIPDDLYYWVEKHVWLRVDDGVATVGVTAVAAHLAKRIIAASLKTPGRTIERGKSLGTLESGKWVGPVPAPITGTIAAVNDRVKAQPDLVNQDPYGEGWIAKLTPVKWEEERGLLLTGAEAVEAYRRVLETENIVCE